MPDTEVSDLADRPQPIRRRGRSKRTREQFTSEDERVLVGLILLKKKMSVARVSVHERVQLPVARVQAMANALRAVGLLT